MVNFFWQNIRFMNPRSGQYCDMPNTQRIGEEVRLAVKRHSPHVRDFRCYVNGLMMPDSFSTMEMAKARCEALWMEVYGEYIPNYHDNKMNGRK